MTDPVAAGADGPREAGAPAAQAVPRRRRWWVAGWLVAAGLPLVHVRFEHVGLVFAAVLVTGAAGFGLHARFAPRDGRRYSRWLQFLVAYCFGAGPFLLAALVTGNVQLLVTMHVEVLRSPWQIVPFVALLVFLGGVALDRPSRSRVPGLAVVIHAWCLLNVTLYALLA